MKLLLRRTLELLELYSPGCTKKEEKILEKGGKFQKKRVEFEKKRVEFLRKRGIRGSVAQ
jgi:hypothetical protein